MVHEAHAAAVAAVQQHEPQHPIFDNNGEGLCYLNQTVMVQHPPNQRICTEAMRWIFKRIHQKQHVDSGGTKQQQHTMHCMLKCEQATARTQQQLCHSTNAQTLRPCSCTALQPALTRDTTPAFSASVRAADAASPACSTAPSGCSRQALLCGSRSCLNCAMASEQLSGAVVTPAAAQASCKQHTTHPHTVQAALATVCWQARR